MLFRRISEHLKAQNWTAVCLDLVIVVLGIFLGLQVSQWYEQRQDISRGEAVLERLHSEFVVITAEARSAFETHQDQVLTLEVVRESIKAGEVDPQKETQFLDGLRYAMGYHLGPSRSGTYVEILSSGQFRLLSDPELRSALSDYDDSVQKADSLFSVFQQNQRLLEPVFNRHFFRGPSREMEFDESPTGLLMNHGEITGYDLDAMKNDEEFLGSLSRLIEYHINFQFWHGNIQRAADRVLSLLEPGES